MIGGETADMARSTKGGSRRSNSGQGGFGRVLVGALVGALVALLCVAAYFTFGSPPVAVTDKPPVWEPLVQSVPLRARAKAEAKRPPFSASEDVFEAGAKIYRTQCADCHGAPGHDAPLGRGMVPRATQFFSARDHRGKAADAPGEIYWKTAFGVRLSGMPAYRSTLTDTQLWQVSLLLHSAGDELPDPVRALLTAGYPPPQPSQVTP